MEVNEDIQEGDQDRTCLTLEKALEILRAKLPELNQHYDINSLGIFGSFVRGEQELKSDLDILVEFQSSSTFFRFIELEDYLSQLLGVKVDLVMKSALKPHIGKRVLAEVISV